MADVSVTLPSAIVYVTGTVNGVTVTFTLSGTNTWAATCDSSGDDIYILEIEAIDGAGNVLHYNITLYYGLQLITDRTAADVANETAKGYYNATDLNRVGSAMKWVRDRLIEYGYICDISPKIDYAIQDVPIATQMAQYLSDLDTLKTTFVVYSTTPSAPSTMDLLGYISANNIEQILKDIDALITNMVAAFVYSGEVYSGEV